MPEKPKTPTLPKGMTANQTLNDTSAKERVELAKHSGMTTEAYERYLEQRAKQERVEASIDAVQKSHTTSSEKSEHDIAAERAVIEGIRSVDISNSQILDTDEENKMTDEAMTMLNKRDALFDQPTINMREADRLQRAIVPLFRKVLLSQMARQYKMLMSSGSDASVARKRIAVELEEAMDSDNVPFRRVIRQRIWEQMIRGTATSVRELYDLADEYNNGRLSKQQQELMSRVVECMKAAYFKGRLTTDILSRFQLSHLRKPMQRVFTRFKEVGPYRKTSSNVAGPVETFTPVQSSDEVMGYRRVGKRRPHRDPSGGSGDDN